MGLGCACFGLSSSSSPKRSPDLNDNSVGFLTKPKTQIMNRNSSNRNSINIKKKMQFPPQETQHQFEEEKREFTTFKDWLLASPPTNGFHTSNGDEVSQRNFLKQNKVHPSLVEDCTDYGYNNPRRSFSKQRLLMGGEVDYCSSMDRIVPSLRKNPSEKMKKRVSFRLPEEADIFIYNLTEEDE